MTAYYLQIAWRSFRAARALTALMVVALGLGIGACMTTLTVYHVLSGDPIPTKSARLFNVQLDAADLSGYHPGEDPTFELTRYDATELLRQHRAPRQAMLSGTHTAVSLPDGRTKALLVTGRMTSADFFAMFDAPFRYGGPWDAAADAAAARVVVLSSELNEQLFGGENSVGREVVVRSQSLRVIGVLADWRPRPHVWDLTLGSYAEVEGLFLPFSTAMAIDLGHSGNMDCWGDNNGAKPTDLASPCSWVQYWVELASPADAAAYRAYLARYSEDQRRAGRFQRPPNPRLRDVMDWLDNQHVLPADVRLQLWLAFGFLLVCVVNMVGLQLAKTLRRSAEIGVRRALGASRGAIFAQFLVEAVLVGAAGGALGLLLASAGLWLVRQSPNDYAALARLDAPMLAATLAISLAGALLAGVLPAWRAATIAPASQLKLV